MTKQVPKCLQKKSDAELAEGNRNDETSTKLPRIKSNAELAEGNRNDETNTKLPTKNLMPNLQKGIEMMKRVPNCLE